MCCRWRFNHMLGCNIYISEGLNLRLIEEFKACASGSPGTALVHTFIDKPYNRTGFTLASPSTQKLAGAAARLAQAALAVLDLRQHAATHPRLGIVDHISCHPLGAAARLQAAADAARAIGQELGSGELAVPVLLYGAAHSGRQTLADIRRACGYFKGARDGHFRGSADVQLPATLAPDYGPREVDPHRGIATIGAVPWVVNYNVLLDTDDMALARRMARVISSRGGGPLCVEAMALPHTAGMEIACNLLDVAATPADAVGEAIQKQAAAQGVAVLKGYRTNNSPEELCKVAEEALVNQASD